MTLTADITNSITFMPTSALRFEIVWSGLVPLLLLLRCVRMTLENS